MSWCGYFRRCPTPLCSSSSSRAPSQDLEEHRHSNSYSSKVATTLADSINSTNCPTWLVVVVRLAVSPTTHIALTLTITTQTIIVLPITQIIQIITQITH